MFEPFQGEGEVNSAFRAGDGVDFVDDDGGDGAEDGGRLGGEHEVGGFRGGDENVGWVANVGGSFGGGGVAAADGHGDIGVVDPEPGGGVVDAGERCVKVEFHIGA